jgi:hypothetical protein
MSSSYAATQKRFSLQVKRRRGHPLAIEIGKYT